jgi:hypothetical protein
MDATEIKLRSAAGKARLTVGELLKEIDNGRLLTHAQDPDGRLADTTQITAWRLRELFDELSRALS